MCICKQVCCSPSMALCTCRALSAAAQVLAPGCVGRACQAQGPWVSRAVSRAGVELLQPSTALAGLALFALLYCALARLWSTRRSPLKQILDKHPLPHEEESRLQASASCKPLLLRSCVLGIICAGTD